MQHNCVLILTGVARVSSPWPNVLARYDGDFWRAVDGTATQIFALGFGCYLAFLAMKELRRVNTDPTEEDAGIEWFIRGFCTLCALAAAILAVRAGCNVFCLLTDPSRQFFELLAPVWRWDRVPLSDS